MRRRRWWWVGRWSSPLRPIESSLGGHATRTGDGGGGEEASRGQVRRGIVVSLSLYVRRGMCCQSLRAGGVQVASNRVEPVGLSGRRAAAGGAAPGRSHLLRATRLPREHTRMERKGGGRREEREKDTQRSNQKPSHTIADVCRLSDFGPDQLRQPPRSLFASLERPFSQGIAGPAVSHRHT